jgi:hypothetical protein
MNVPSFTAETRRERAAAWAIGAAMVVLAAGSLVWAANPPSPKEIWVRWRPHAPDPTPPPPRPRRYETPLFERDLTPPI